MTIHQCPKCELRFDWNTELDDHCRHDHPQFRHEYPAQAAPQPDPEPVPEAHRAQPVPGGPVKNAGGGLLGWLTPLRPGR
ncbi:MAG: hypothetical protein ACRDWT_16505 [Jatrophihabitantaceae bacterium]